MRLSYFYILFLFRRCRGITCRCAFFYIFLHLATVLRELARKREFAQAVANHFLFYCYGEVLPAVMYADSKAYHVRRDLRVARPRLDSFRLASGAELHYFLH